MPSTYTTNNGLEKIGTGEQSGTWGDTTNLNFDILDQALDGLVTITATDTGSSGSPNSLPITDGTLSDGRNRLIIITDGGDLGGSVYYQLTPADAEKIVFLRNSLSGSRDLILFQGTYNSARDLIVPAGKDVVVKFSGTGTSTAVVAPVFADLSLDAATIGSADINGGTIDGVTIGVTSVATVINVDNLKLDGNTLSSTNTNGNVVLAPNGDGDVQLDADTVRVGDSNTDVTITTNGTGDLTLNTNGGTNSGSIEIQDGVNTNIIVTANGTGKLELANGDITTSASTGSDAAGTDLTIQAGASTGNAAGGDMVFQTTPAGAGSGTNLNSYTTVLTLTDDSKLKIGTSTAVSSILDEDDMSSNSATALSTQQSIKAYVDAQVGTVDTLAEVLANGNTTGGTAIQMTTTDELQFRDTGLKISSSADGQLDIDSDGTIDINATTSIAFDTDTLFVDSANDRVGINNTGAAGYDLYVGNGLTGTKAFALNGQGSSSSVMNLDLLGGGTGNPTGRIAFSSSTEALSFSTGDNASITTAMTIDSSQRVLIGTNTARADLFNTTATAALQVEGTTGNTSAASIVRNSNDDNGPQFILGKSNGTSVGSDTIVTDNALLGRISYQGADGSELVEGARIESQVDGTPGANDMPGRLQFYTTADGASSPTERMRITSDAKVSINKSNPSYTLEVQTYGTNNGDMRVGGSSGNTATGLSFDYSNSGTTTATIQNNYGTSSGSALLTIGSGKTDFKTGTSQSLGMRIDSSQRVLIGGQTTARSTFSITTSGGVELSVEGTNADNSKIATVRNTDGVNGPYLVLGKTRASAVNGVTQVVNGDQLGSLSFQGADGVQMREAALIRGEVDGAVDGSGAADMPGRMIFATTPDGSVSATERMRINSSGMVIINNGNVSTGAGTNKALLQVANIDTTSDWTAINTGANGYASTANEIAVLNTANQDLNGFAGIFLQAGENSNGSSINSARIGAIKTSTSGTNTDLGFAVRGGDAVMAEAMRIDSSQRVVIGSASVSQKWWNSTSYGTLFGVENNNRTNANFYVTGGFIRNSSDSEGPQIALGKSRGTTSGSTTIVQNDDTIGLITSQGADGTNLVEASRISTAIDGTPGANDMPGRLQFFTTADGASSPTERMRIRNSGTTIIDRSGENITTATTGAALEVHDGHLVHSLQGSAQGSRTFVKFFQFNNANGTAPTSATLTLSGFNGEFYCKITLVGLNSYSGNSSLTYINESVGYPGGTGFTVISANRYGAGTGFSFGTATFTGSTISIPVTSGGTSYRFFATAEIISIGILNDPAFAYS